MKMRIDLILFNGIGYSTPFEVPIGEAIAISNGNIIAIGTNEDVLKIKSSKTKIIDLKGNIFLPGLIDTHCHVRYLGLLITQIIDCSSPPLQSITEILTKIQQKAKQIPKGNWIVAENYNDTLLVENRHPTKSELDQVAPHHPVLLNRLCRHMGVLNSKALEIVGINSNTKALAGGAIERDKKTGELTGLLKETHWFSITDNFPQYSKEERKNALLAGLKQFSQWGVTTVHDAWVSSIDFQNYQELAKEERLPIRVRMILSSTESEFKESILNSNLQTDFGNDQLKITGMKYFMDGGIGGKTAALSHLYRNSENQGILHHTQEELNQFVEILHQKKLRPCIHGIGDEAIRMILYAYKRVLGELLENDLEKLRYRIEHFGYVTPDILLNSEKLHLVPSLLHSDFYAAGDSYLENLGAEKMKFLYPFRTLTKSTIIPAVSSDAPASPGNPWLGLWCMLTRKTFKNKILAADETIDIPNALTMHTINGAYAGFDEKRIGTLEVRKKADIIVIDKDIFNLKNGDLHEVKDIKVLLTICNGQIIHAKPF